MLLLSISFFFTCVSGIGESQTELNTWDGTVTCVPFRQGEAKQQIRKHCPRLMTQVSYLMVPQEQSSINTTKKVFRHTKVTTGVMEAIV